MDKRIAKLILRETDNAMQAQIQLWKPVLDALGGAEYVNVYKPEDHRWIVLEPVNIVGDLKAYPNALKITRRYNRGLISIRAFIYDGRLNKAQFGKCYRVRKDKKGRVYICLNEEVENE